MSFYLDGVGYAHANGKAALGNIRLAAAQGEHLALIGPSGAGKTTLLRLLGGALRPAAGRLELLGSDPWRLSARQLASLRSTIGTAHQAPPLPPRQRVVTAILAGRLGQWPAWKGLLSLLYPLDIPGARAALAPFDLADRLFDRCDRLSGGQLQRVGLARLVYQEARLMLADEPVSALDPALARHSLAILAAAATARGATLVASLHAVDLALALFPRIVGIKDGGIAFDLPASQVTDSLLHQLYAGEGSQLPTQAAESAGAALLGGAANDPLERIPCC